MGIITSISIMDDYVRIDGGMGGYFQSVSSGFCKTDQKMEESEWGEWASVTDWIISSFIR